MVTDIVFDDYLGKWNYRAIPKVKTRSYFLALPYLISNAVSCLKHRAPLLGGSWVNKDISAWFYIRLGFRSLQASK
ncbi:hypothetical protein BGV40_10905 [Methanosarcina sp. Ant1]|nr:hypothetical protein BGV40_10905 [Methanosarcina sp. Ant1]